MIKSYIVDSTYSNMRLDRWLRNKIGNIPQSLIEKSLRTGKVSIKEAYAETKKGQLFLINADISNYDKAASYSKIESKRVRKLLVHKKEISKLQGKIEKEGMTIIPLKIYFNKKGIAKIEIAIAKGKKLYDKRESKKKRDWNIQKKRLLKKIN